MKRKRISAFLLSLIILIVSVCGAAAAFADDVNWRYDADTHTLYLFGSGSTDDYTSVNQTPWASRLSELEAVVAEDGVTRIGNCCFSGASNLASVTLADSVAEIGANTFASCPSLQAVSFSESVISIADVSMAYNGATAKPNFVITAPAGSYALSFAYKNNISFVSEDVRAGVLHVSLQKGMTAYFPYTCHYSGRYRFYSVSKHDSLGYIYDSNKTQVAYNDDHGTAYHPDMGSTDFGLTKTLTKGERYYLAVKVFNPSLKANFDVYFEPETYTVSGTVYAMNSPQGDASALALDNLTMNGTACPNGDFTVTVNGVSETATFVCDGVTMQHTFTVEDGDEIELTMMMCDVNHDGIVNAKDYAAMRRSNSRYLPLFDNFINYRSE